MKAKTEEGSNAEGSLFYNEKHGTVSYQSDGSLQSLGGLQNFKQ